VNELAAGAGAGVDQEKAGVGVAFPAVVPGDLMPGLAPICSHPASNGFPDPPPAEFPLTRRSKSSSEVPFVASSEEPAMVPNDIKSSLGAAGEPFPTPSS